MKRLFGAIIIVLILYVIYHDLNDGTLPTENKKNDAIPVSTVTDMTYIEEVVKPGDTVLTIVKKNSQNPLPVSITKLIADFQKLNAGKKPEEIQIGENYKFPTYHNPN